MSDARERILGDIRAALGRRAPLPESVGATLEERLRHPRANVLPAVEGDLVKHFIGKVEAVNGKVTRVASVDGVSRAVSRHIKAHALPYELVVAPGLAAIRWSNRFAVERRAAHGSDRISVTGAYAGVAESGTLVLLSGPESPTTLNFLPEDHIVVLEESRIVRHLEDVWARLRAEQRDLPRSVNLITGPSKTADVEQTIQEGAHGPRRLQVILVKGGRPKE